MAIPTPPLKVKTKQEVEQLIKTWLEQNNPGSQPDEPTVINFLKAQGFEIDNVAELNSAIGDSWTAYDADLTSRANQVTADNQSRANQKETDRLSSINKYRDVILYKLNVKQRTNLKNILSKDFR